MTIFPQGASSREPFSGSLLPTGRAICERWSSCGALRETRVRAAALNRNSFNALGSGTNRVGKLRYQDDFRDIPYAAGQCGNVTPNPNRANMSIDIGDEPSGFEGQTRRYW